MLWDDAACMCVLKSCRRVSKLFDQITNFCPLPSLSYKFRVVAGLIIEEKLVQVKNRLVANSHRKKNPCFAKNGTVGDLLSTVFVFHLLMLTLNLK